MNYMPWDFILDKYDDGNEDDEEDEEELDCISDN
jgi:hypothetical protein